MDYTTEEKSKQREALSEKMIDMRKKYEKGEVSIESIAKETIIDIFGNVTNNIGEMEIERVKEENRILNLPLDEQSKAYLEMHEKRLKEISERRMKEHEMKGGKTFENFDAYNDDLVKAKKKVKSFNDSKFKILFLSGRPGTGKTHLARAAAFEYRYKCIDSLDLYPIYKNDKYGFDNDKPSRFDYSFNDLLNGKIIIDDLGAESDDNKGLTVEALKLIIDRNPDKIIITSNMSKSEIEAKYGPRIVSRLFESCLICGIEAPDFRDPMNKIKRSK